MQITSNNYKQNFGMSLKLSESAKLALSDRTKNSEIQELDELLNKLRANKKIGVFLYSMGGKNATRLGANLYDVEGKFPIKYSKEDAYFTQNSPLDFVKNIVVKANKISSKIDKKTNNWSI